MGKETNLKMFILYCLVCCDMISYGFYLGESSLVLAQWVIFRIYSVQYSCPMGTQSVGYYRKQVKIQKVLLYSTE